MTLLDRYLGTMFGLAVGDAIGTALEFMKPGEFAPLTDMVGGGPFGLPVGAWTDDTSMALCLAASITEKNAFDPYDQMCRYRMWLEQGYMSSTTDCFDIGRTCHTALGDFKKSIMVSGDDADPFCGSTDLKTGGNGSIMRLAPVPLAFYHDPDALSYCIDSSRTTHGSPECLDACVVLGAMIVSALGGHDKETILGAKYLTGLSFEPKIQEIVDGSYKVKNPPDIRGDGYVVLSLEAALWAFHNSSTFEEGVLKAANLGEDADTTAAVYGQIAGAFYGYSRIPQRWKDKLVKKELIMGLANQLYVFASAHAVKKR